MSELDLGIDTSGDRTLVNIRCDRSIDDCEILKVMASSVRKTAEDLLEEYYRGRVPDVGPAENSKARGFIHNPVCNSENALFGSGPERTTNHLRQPCGASWCSAKLVKRCLVCGRTECNYRPSSSVLANPVTCERERAWKRGALVHQVELTLNQVEQDILQRHRVSIGSRCASLVRDRDFIDLQGTYRSLSQAWHEVNGGQPTTCDLSSPSPDELKEGDEGFFRNDRRIPKQAGCLLLAARTALMTSLTHLALCEVFARAEHRWYGVVMPAVETVVPETFEEAGQRCGGKVKTRKDLECLNQNYQALIQERFLAAIRNPESVLQNGSSDTYHFAPLGVISRCPTGAPDCRKCSDVIVCGAGSAFAQAEFGEMVAALDDFKTVQKGILTALQYFSDSPKIDVFGLKKRWESHVCTPSGDSQEFSENFSSPRPSPGLYPSEEPRGRQDDPGLTQEITFPGRRKLK